MRKKNKVFAHSLFSKYIKKTFVIFIKPTKNLI